MHLLLIHQAFVSPGEPGGTRHYEFARHLVDTGHACTIVASDLSYLTGQRTIAHRGAYGEQDLDGVRVLRAYTYPSLHRSFVWRIVAFFSFMLSSVWAALHAGQVDLVMGTSPPIFQAASAWIVSLLRHQPFLLEVRDLWPEFAIDMGVLSNPLLIALSRWLERFLYARADHIVVNSPAYRDYMLGKAVPENKVTVIPNGVDPAPFQPEARGGVPGAELGKAVRDELGLDGQFVVTYAGALGQANDIPTILRAAERLRGRPEVRFLLVGDGKERLKLEAQAEAMRLPNVTFAGPRPKAEIPAVLAASDACVATLLDIPMFRTTYPNKVFDYMAAGRPTLLGIDGVIREVVEAGQGGICVPPGDDAALAQAVLSLYRDPARAQAMGRSARAHVEAHFARQQQAEAFAALAAWLIEERR